MSDYLWDKSGEPDAEVERLETLLASLRHTPRPLALPEDVAADAAPSARRSFAWRRLLPARIFEPVWLAAAAALLLTFMLGAGALMRGRLAADEDRAASHDARQRQTQGPSRQSPTPEPRQSPPAPQEAADAARGPESVNVPAKGNGVVTVVKDVPGRRAGAQTADFSKPRQRQAVTETEVAERGGRTGTLEAMSARGREGAASLFDGTRLMAKEQLIYALRLTGAKLKEVQGKAHGADDSERAPGGGVR